jgi:hypothetical protein
MKIVTSHMPPPIPTRNFDWVAYFEGDEEGLSGHGATEKEAILELYDLCQTRDIFDLEMFCAFNEALLKADK